MLQCSFNSHLQLPSKVLDTFWTASVSSGNILRLWRDWRRICEVAQTLPKLNPAYGRSVHQSTLSCFDHSRSVCIDVTPKALRDCIFRTSYLWLYLTADRRYCDTLMPSTVWLCVCYSRVFRVNRTHNYSGPRRPFHVPFIILSDVHRHRSR